MKNTILLLSLLFSSSAFAQVDEGKTYANPKTLNMNCELASIYGNTNDSWGITIKGLEVAFWDNDSYTFGKYVGIGYDNTISPSDRSYGNGRFFVYKGPKGDAWELIIGPTYLLESNQVDNRAPHIYGTLKVPGKMKKQIMECKVITLAAAKEVLDQAKE